MSLSRFQTLRNFHGRATPFCLRLAGTRLQPNLQTQISSSRIQTLFARKPLIAVRTAPGWPAGTERRFATSSSFIKGDAHSLEDNSADLVYVSELRYARGVVEKSKIDPESIAVPLKTIVAISDEEEKEILSRDWSRSKGTEILDNFRSLSCHAKLNSLRLSHEKHGAILYRLGKKLQDLNDEQLQQVFQCLTLWEGMQSPTTVAKPEYEMLCTKMDEECGKRQTNWSTEKQLMFADYWCQLFLARKSRYFRQMMIVLSKKPQQLTPMNYLHLMFLANMSKVRAANMYEMEYHLDKILDEFTINEIGVICMTFFKNTTPFRDQKLMSRIQRKLLKEWNDVNDHSFTAIMKMTRYSSGLKEMEILYEILDRVKARGAEFSVPCFTHNIHAAAYFQYHDPEFTQMVIDRFEKNIDSVRIKDMERVTWALSMFDYDSKTPLYHKIVESLRNPNRKEEKAKFPQVTPTTLMHLSFAGVFPIDLIQECFEPDFLSRICNGNLYKMGWHFLPLENNVRIEVPEYEGPFMKDSIREYLAKKHAPELKPTKDDETNKFTLNVAHVCKLVLASDTAVHIGQVLPHFRKLDLIVCLDEANNPVPPASVLSKMPDGSIKYQEAGSFRWIAIVLATQNQMLKGTNKFVGPFASKLRQLKKIGYTPVAIPFNVWRDLPNLETKQQYLRNLLSLVPDNDQRLVSSEAN